MNQKRMTPDEREMICFLEGVVRAFSTYEGRLKNLCRRVNGVAKITRMSKTISGLLEEIAQTVPNDQLFKIVQQMRMTDVHVGLKKPTGKPEDYWVMSYSDAATLADYATRTECIACDGKKHNCPLRDVLKDLPVMGITNYYVACWQEEDK